MNYKKLNLIICTVLVACSTLLFSFLPIAGQEKKCLEKRYTVNEIDELRKVCEYRYLFGTSYRSNNAGQRTSRVYRETDKVKAVEELVRTYMLAGVTAKDILAEDKKKHEEWQSKLMRRKIE